MKAKAGTPRRWQNNAYLTGFCAGTAILACIVALPGGEKFQAKGPMNTGHETLACSSCHRVSQGSFRQQIQANLRYALELRKTPVEFGRKPVGNEQCLDCHNRPNDRHPVYRFLEPRFAKTREALHPHRCVSCHAEHNNKRVTLADGGYCVNCHKDTKLKKDPLDVSHATLIEQKRWNSCLGCHDFHGNHIMKTERSVEKAIPSDKIRTYFDGGPSPYGTSLYYKSKKEGQGG
jgi:hypothetical protein